MKLKKHYMLMISCPGDVVRERELLKKCVERINAERGDDIWVELKYWVTDTFSDASMPAQDSINQQIVNDSDGLIAIFNARLGTPVHGYKCGTDEEINLMLNAHKHVSLLFNNKPIVDLTKNDLIEQLTALIEYKNENNTKAYYRTFESEESFSELAMQEIRLWLRSFSSNKHDAFLQSISIDEVIEQEQAEETSQKQETQMGESDKPSEAKSNDEEDGIIDVVLNFTDAANGINREALNYTKELDSLAEETRSFTEQYKFLMNAGKASALKAASIKYSDKLIMYSNNIDGFNERIESQWKKFYDNMLSYASFTKKKDDRIILLGSAEQLEKAFMGTYESTKDFLSAIEGMPNIQKSFNSARKQLALAVRRTVDFLNTAVEDCDNLIDKLNA